MTTTNAFAEQANTKNIDSARIMPTNDEQTYSMEIDSWVHSSATAECANDMDIDSIDPVAPITDQTNAIDIDTGMTSKSLELMGLPVDILCCIIDQVQQLPTNRDRTFPAVSLSQANRFFRGYVRHQSYVSITNCLRKKEKKQAETLECGWLSHGGAIDRALTLTGDPNFKKVVTAETMVVRFERLQRVLEAARKEAQQLDEATATFMKRVRGPDRAAWHSCNEDWKTKTLHDMIFRLRIDSVELRCSQWQRLAGAIMDGLWVSWNSVDQKWTKCTHFPGNLKSMTVSDVELSLRTLTEEMATLRCEIDALKGNLGEAEAFHSRHFLGDN